VGRLLSFEKPVGNRTPTPFRVEEGNTANTLIREWFARSCVA